MPIEYDTNNSRQYVVARRGIKYPSSKWTEIVCPFCNTTVRAYHWSLAGGGKKCPGCSAKHDYYGNTAQIKKKES